MKYVSIDIETTGLDPDGCQILEFGAVIEDTDNAHIPVEELPTFRRILDHGHIQGEPFALNLNAGILKILSKKYDSCADKTAAGIIDPDELAIQFGEWLQDNGINSKKIIAAGKNFANFDLRFIRRLPMFNVYCGFHHRILDPMMMFVHFDEDKTPPDSKTVMDRAGLQDYVVAHTAVEDAQMVVEMMRRGYGLGPHTSPYDRDRNPVDAVKRQFEYALALAKNLGVEIRAIADAGNHGIALDYVHEIKYVVKQGDLSIFPAYDDGPLPEPVQYDDGPTYDEVPVILRPVTIDAKFTGVYDDTRPEGAVPNPTAYDAAQELRFANLTEENLPPHAM